MFKRTFLDSYYKDYSVSSKDYPEAILYTKKIDLGSRTISNLPSYVYELVLQQPHYTRLQSAGGTMQRDNH